MYRQLGILSSIIFITSMYLPYISLGPIELTPLKLLDTRFKDWIGFIVLFTGCIVVALGVDKKLSVIVTIFGGLLPLYRFGWVTYYHFSDLKGFDRVVRPSFEVGGYLILLTIVLQIYACLKTDQTAASLDE